MNHNTNKSCKSEKKTLVPVENSTSKRIYRGHQRGGNAQAEFPRKQKKSPESTCGGGVQLGGDIPGGQNIISVNSRIWGQKCQKFCGAGEQSECLEVAGVENEKSGLARPFKGLEAAIKSESLTHQAVGS